MKKYPLRDHIDWEEAHDYEKQGGHLTHMSPDEYLARVKPLNMDHDDKHIIHHFKKQMEKGEKFDPVAIESDGHPNGRHRAHAAKKLGIKSIPVIMMPRQKRADGGPLTPRSLAQSWIPPEETDPRLGRFIEEYPSKMAEAIKETVSFPHDVYTGEKQLYSRDPETGEPRLSDEAIRKALDISGGAMTGTFGIAPAMTGAVLGSGPIRAAENPRVNMNFRDVTKRVPELQEGAKKVASGDMTPAQYQELVNAHKPVSEWDFVPQPASYEEMANAVRSNQLDKVGKGSTIPAGHPVGLRLDIPSYQSSGIWVPTIHDKSITGKQPVMAHEPVALISDAVFHVPENKALGIAKGGEKSPLATINGSWVPSSQEEAVAMAQAALKDKEWRQVGMDPERHGYFYDRGTQEPILGAEQVLQVGPLVLAKNPRYGSKKDFKYETGGSVVERALMLTSKKAASRRGRPETLRSRHV